MTKRSPAPSKLLLASGLSGFFSAAVAVPEVSIDGSAYRATTSPFTLRQDGRSNSVGVVDTGGRVDSAVMQTGYYNRAAILQFGNDKLAILRQPGQFNRALIVQIGTAESDVQTADTRQGSSASAANYLFTAQTSAAGADPLSRQFAALTVEQARTVATNFIESPEIAGVNVGLLEDVTLHVGSLLEARLDRQRFRACPEPFSGQPGAGAGSSSRIQDCPSPFFAELSYGHAERDAVMGVAGYSQSLRSATLGADLRVSPATRLGVALSLVESDASIDAGLGRTDSSSYQLGGFAAFDAAPLHLDVAGSIGKSSFDTRRFGGPMHVRGETDGWSYGARTQLGYFLGSDTMHLGPLIAAGYSNGRVDGYREQGSPLLTQWIDSQDRERLVAAIGGLLDRQDRIGDHTLQTFVKLELERDFGIGRDDVAESRFGFAPDALVYTPVGDVGEDTYGKVSGGLTLTMGTGLGLSLGGSARFGADRNDNHNLYGALSFAF